MRQAAVRRGLRAVALAALLVAGSTAAARADGTEGGDGAGGSVQSGEMFGNVVSGACAPVSYDPASGSVECHGQAWWTGWFSGPGTFHATGQSDAITGDASGTITEHVRGSFGPLGSGEIFMAGEFKITGSTGAQVVRLTITRATGALAGLEGTLEVRGTALITGGPSLMSYDGSWTKTG